MKEKLKGKQIVWLLIAACAVVLIGGIVIITSLLNGGSKGGMDYYDSFTSIFTNELGTFKYVIDVQTREIGEAVTLEETDLDDETEDEVGGGSNSRFTFTEWGNSDDVKTGDWEYPNYQIIIEGCTTSTAPLVTNFTVTVVTEYYNDLFTEVSCFDGMYYIDIESMRKWLVNSGDSYLLSLGAELPQGSKYLTIPASEFFVESRYAEDGEAGLSSVNGLEKVYQRFLVGVLTFKNTVKGSMGAKGQNVSENAVTLNLSGGDAVDLLKVVKSTVTRIGDFYDSVLASKPELWDESQTSQYKREEDNVISAWSDFATYLNTADLNSLGFQVTGVCRSYVNGKGNQTVEGSFGMVFTGSHRNYLIQIEGLRSGDRSDVTLPVGSTVAASSLGGYGFVTDTLNSMADYMNVSMVKTEVKLDITPDSIKEKIYGDFISLVNQVGTAPYYVTRNNIEGFIQEYAGKKDLNGDDAVNAKLVDDLLDTINKVSGGIVIERVIYAEDDIEQYPEVYYEYGGGAEQTWFTVNHDETTSELLVLDVRIINRYDGDYNTSADNYEIHDLIGGVYPSNNETILRSYDSGFDFDSLEHEIHMSPWSYKEYKLYFVVSSTAGHLELFMNGQNLGVIQQY